MSKKGIVTLVLIVILLSVLVIYSVLGIFQLVRNPTRTFAVEKGKIAKEEATQGYIIREEEVITGQNYKNGISQIKSEGERVAKEEAIFRYYTNGEENLIKKIKELDVKIQEAWNKDDTNIFSPDIKLLENQIEQKLNAIYKLNNMQKIREYKKEVTDYVTKKAKIAGDLSPAGSYLKGLIEQRSEYENRLNFGSEYIKAPKAGIVSYRVDGLEAILTPESFGNLNKEMLQKLNLKTGQIVSMNGESGKIIENYECYIACILNSEEAEKAVVGEKVVLRISGEKEVEAEIEYTAKQSETEHLIVFKIEKYIEELISYRKISLDIVWWQYSGWKIPNSALKQYKEDLYYIVRQGIGYTDNIFVKVLRQTEDYCIIENYTTKELEDKIETMKSGQEEEDRQIEEFVNKSKKISIYDEILL